MADMKIMKLPVKYTTLERHEVRLVREEYVKQQGGKCYYCKKSLTGNPPIDLMRKKIIRELFPPNFFKWPVHLHHDHNTGMTIGAVHNRCNAILWQYEGE